MLGKLLLNLYRAKRVWQTGVVDAKEIPMGLALTATVELDRPLEGNHCLVVALCLSLGVFLKRDVQVRDVRVMVLGVVQLEKIQRRLEDETRGLVL